MVTAVAGLAIYSEATAPNPFLPSRQMMIGTWRSPSGAVLTLRSDGTFASRGLSASAGESSTENIPAEGTGEWHVGPVPAEPAGVIFDFSPKVFMELLVERVGSSVVMYFDEGDPDEGVTGQYQFTSSGEAADPSQ